MVAFAVFVAFLLAGWFAWTFAEYLMHRFAMHEARGRGIASRSHLTHHADRDSILEKWPLAWSGVLLAGWGLGSLVTPALGIGWVLGYGFYDLQHYLAHRRAPRGRYQRFVRRHHFHHHFGHPMANHGVTWPVWDKAFGTYEEPGVIRVPRRLALVWLLDADGRGKPQFAADYEVVGSAPADAAQRARDHADAFANRAPAPV